VTARYYRLLGPIKEAGISLAGVGRQIVASFLGSPAFTVDGAREQWVRRAIWAALTRGADSPGGYIVRQAQAQEIDWLSPEERREFEADREFGRGGCWTPRALRGRPAASRTSADCTRAERAAGDAQAVGAAVPASRPHGPDGDDDEMFGPARASHGPWGVDDGAQAPTEEDWARVAARLDSKAREVEP